jgi:hypothetical protein
MVNTTDGSPEALLSEVTEGAYLCDLSELAVPSDVVAVAQLEAQLDSAITTARAQGFNKVWFKFGLATAGSGQTLFAPVGKALRARLAGGVLLRAMPASSGGWIVRLA